MPTDTSATDDTRAYPEPPSFTAEQERLIHRAACQLVAAEVLQPAVSQRRDRLSKKFMLYRRLRHQRPLASKSMRGSMMVYIKSPTSVITRPSSEKKNSVPKITG